MRLEIVTHCWRYSRLLTYQLSSLVLYPPRTLSVTMTVFYSDLDVRTCRVLDCFSRYSPRHVTWRWWKLEKRRLLRRAIGRNLAALQTEADWIWFADADMCFRNDCLDRAFRVNRPALDDHSVPLVYPRRIRISRDHASGDAAVAAADGEAGLRDVRPTDFVRLLYKRAIGGAQICRGDVARQLGYCRHLPEYMTGADVWQETYEDREFRLVLGTPGVPIRVRHLFRIRHSQCGQEHPEVEL